MTNHMEDHAWGGDVRRRWNPVAYRMRLERLDDEQLCRIQRALVIAQNECLIDLSCIAKHIEVAVEVAAARHGGKVHDAM